MTPASKADLRRAAKAVPAASPLESVRVCDHVIGLLDTLAPHSVMTYLALPGEIDLGRLPADRPHISWVVSRTPDTGWLTTHPLGARRERHPFGFEQPVEDAAQVRLDEVDVVLVPGLAFDPHGMRLGRGKGYYDELLGRCRPDATAVGITLERRVFDRIPSEPHDRRVDWLVTEIGARRVRPA